MTLGRLFRRRRKPEPLARVTRDEWIEWMRLGGVRPATIVGYRRTTEKLLKRAAA